MQDTVVKFGKPYSFEGKEYTEVDLKGYESFTTQDLIEINTQWKAARGNALLPEFDLQWNCFAAARATKLPVEFFLGLPSKEGKKVCNIGIAFFQE